MIALVTGASSGIGRDIAKELAKKGYDIIAVARNREALENLKKEIDNVKVDIQILDVTNREGCIQLHDEMIKKYGFVDVVVNNAGFGTCGKFVDTDLNKEIKMIDTNITALHMLTKLFLIDMVKEDKGYIMNVASIAGFMPGPLMATYYSSKAYVVRLTQSIRQELFMMKSHVKISALCPGPVKTNFGKVADVQFSLKEVNSQWVARYAVNKMFKNKILIFPGVKIWLARIGAKIMPDQFMAFICYFMQKRKIK